MEIKRPHAFGETKYSILDNLIYTLRRRQVVRRLSVVQAPVIADLGSGFDARLLVGLLDDNTQATAVAFDMAFSASLTEKKRLTTIVGDLNDRLQYDENTINIALSLAVLEHLDEPQSFLGEVFRILKPGGTLLLTTPGPKSKWLLEFLAFKLRVIDADEILDHKNYFSSTDLFEMCKQAGFEDSMISTQTFLFGMNNIVSAVKK